MQRTADFHDHITDARLSQAVGVVDDAAALDTAVDMLDAHAPTRDASIRGFLRAREGAASRLPGRHEDLDLSKGERQEAQILKQSTARRQGVGSGIGNPLIMRSTPVGLAQKEDCERGVDQEHVFDRVVLFLAAITARLLSRILGAFDAPFGPIMAKRGDAGGGAGTAAGRAHGGGDPAAWIRRVKDRMPVVHLKDMAVVTEGWNVQQVMAEIGEGNLNWPEILSACREANVEWYAVEQDVCQRDPFESLQISYQNLKAMGFE